MARRFRDLIEAMAPERRVEHERNVQRLRAQTRLDDMRLDELRRALRLSQQTLARRLKTDQAQISRLEQRADLFVSTLRRYVEALGGELEIVATFPDGATVAIENFHDLDSGKAGQRRSSNGAKRARKRRAGVP